MFILILFFTILAIGLVDLKFNEKFKSYCTKCGKSDFDYSSEPRVLVYKGNGGSISFKYRTCKNCGRRVRI